MREDQYVVIQAFMLNELHLKGNELIVYATIYGFTQDGEHWFYGTKGYLAEWCGATKVTVGSCLKSLVSKGFIERRERTEHGQLRVEYRATKNVTPHQETCTPPVKNLVPPHQESLPIDKIETQPSEEPNENIREIPYSTIIDHLNQRAGTRYRRGRSTCALIRARWSEGYRLDDFERVIDVKCAEWLGTDMAKYLRPETLFGGKFEGYLNQPAKGKKSHAGLGCYD